MEKDTFDMIRQTLLLALLTVAAAGLTSCGDEAEPPDDRTRVERLIDELGDDSPVLRAAAAQALGRTRSPEAGPALIGALEDTAFEVRAAAADALGQIRYPQAVAALEVALADPEREVRLAAADALGRIGTRPAVEALARALRTADEGLRDRLVRSLRNVPDRSLLTPDLLEAAGIETDDPAAAYLAGSTGKAEQVAALIDQLGDSSARKRLAAVEALGWLKDSRAVEPVTERLSDKTERPEIRQAAVVALSGLDARSAVPNLIEALRDDNIEIRLTAAGVLGDLGDLRAVQPLNAALQDPNPAVRAAAANSLRRLGHPPGSADER